MGNYCGDVNPTALDPVYSKYGIWLHDGAKDTLIIGNTCPQIDNLKGGFFAEKGTTYKATANTGITDSEYNRN